MSNLGLSTTVQVFQTLTSVHDNINVTSLKGPALSGTFPSRRAVIDIRLSPPFPHFALPR